MRKYLIIHNPIAGNEKKHIWIDRLSSAIKENNDEVDIIKSERSGHARKIAEKMASNYDVVVSAGGDGTLNEVSSGLLESGSDTALGVLPIGSGNDYYRTFGNPSELDEAIEIITGDEVVMADVGKGSDGRFLFNIASIGLDCLTVKTAQKLKKRFGGTLAYVMALIYSLFAFKRQNLDIYIDDRKIEADSILCCFGNGKTYGGGIPIMPWADVSDGFFHIVNIIDISKLFLIFLTPSIAFGKHTSFKKYVKVFKAKKIKVVSDSEYDFNLDGEIFENTRTVEYECIPSALKILVKKSSSKSSVDK